MALTFTNQTYDTKTVSVIDIGTDQIVLENSLGDFDKKHLEAALAEVSLSAYTMPNGQTADVYFAPFSRTAAELTADYKAYRLSTNPAGALSEYETTLDDHEARITALEP